MISGEHPTVGGRTFSVADDDRVLADGRPVAAGDGVARALAARIDPAAADASERAVAVDQTNTSVIVDERLVVKIVGRWAAAERSARLLARLAAAGADGVEQLRGSVAWRHPALGDSVLAVVTDYLPDAADGWTWAVDDVVALVEGTGSEPDWPALLGRRVAGIHDALGALAVPAPPGAAALRRERALAAVQRAVAATGGDEGVRLRNRRGSLEHDAESLAATAPGRCFPIHGDLHLGQVLRSTDAGTGAARYTIIDFDGDPQHEASERERPDAAARDVAHLLVSLDLVAAVAQKRLGRAEPAAFAWADRARGGFLDAYRAALTRAELFDPALLPGFEAEQLAAELGYAERFLPRWRYAPDAAITHRHPSSNEIPEEPWTPPPFEPTSS